MIVRFARAVHDSLAWRGRWGAGRVCGCALIDEKGNPTPDKTARRAAPRRLAGCAGACQAIGARAAARAGYAGARACGALATRCAAPGAYAHQITTSHHSVGLLAQKSRYESALRRHTSLLSFAPACFALPAVSSQTMPCTHEQQTRIIHPVPCARPIHPAAHAAALPQAQRSLGRAPCSTTRFLLCHTRLQRGGVRSELATSRTPAGPMHACRCRCRHRHAL